MLIQTTSHVFTIPYNIQWTFQPNNHGQQELHFPTLNPNGFPEIPPLIGILPHNIVAIYPTLPNNSIAFTTNPRRNIPRCSSLKSPHIAFVPPKNSSTIRDFSSDDDTPPRRVWPHKTKGTELLRVNLLFIKNRLPFETSR